MTTTVETNTETKVVPKIVPAIEDVSPTRKKLTIKVPKADVVGAFDAAIKKMQGTANLKGFRPGKAPANLVKKFYENDIRKNAFEEAVEGSYQEAIKGVEFQIVSFPQIDVVGKFEENEGLEFTAVVDINPQVDIVGYQKLVLKQALPDLDVNAEYEKTVKNLQKQAGTFSVVSEARTAQKGDFVKIDSKILKNGVAVPGKESKNARVELDGSNIPAIEEALLSMKAGESKVVSAELGDKYGDESLRGQTVEFSVKLNAIESLKMPEVNEDFAKKFGAENLEALKKGLTESLENVKKQNKVNALREQIFEQILAKNAFEVPESLVESTIDRVIAQNNSQVGKEAQEDAKNEEVRSKHREWATKEVRGVLALGHVARQEGIVVADAEVSKELSGFAAKNGTTPQQLVKQYGSQIVEEFRGKVLIDKVLEKVIELGTVEMAAN